MANDTIDAMLARAVAHTARLNAEALDAFAAELLEVSGDPPAVRRIAADMLDLARSVRDACGGAS